MKVTKKDIEREVGFLENLLGVELNWKQAYGGHALLKKDGKVLVSICTSKREFYEKLEIIEAIFYEIDSFKNQ